MAKNKLSFDAIFEGNDIKEDAKKRISAMLEDVVATRMEAKDDEDDEEDDDGDEEKNPEAKEMDEEGRGKRIVGTISSKIKDLFDKGKIKMKTFDASDYRDFPGVKSKKASLGGVTVDGADYIIIHDGVQGELDIMSPDLDTPQVTLKVSKTIPEAEEMDPTVDDETDPMTEDADDLAVRLSLQAKGRKFAAKFDNWTVRVGKIKYTLKQLTKMGADVSFIQDDAYDPAEYADEKFVMNIKTQEPLIVPNGNGKPIKWTSFEDPNLDEDDEEDGEKKMEAEAMDPTVDDGEEEDEEVYEEGDADAATDLKSQLSGFMKDDPELLRAFRTGFENPAKARLSLAQMATDLSSNKAAEPATNFVLLLLRWLADKSNAVNMFTQWVKQQKASPDPMMDADDGPINNEYSEAFTNKLDKYLTYVAEEWAENNKIALENGIKVQIAESFLSNMKGMYEQYNFKNIPTRDMVVELGTKVTEAEQKLNEQIEKNAQLRSKYNKQRKEMLVIESSKGLTATQVEKFKKLTEDVAFEDEKSFKNKVAVIKENAFTKTVVKSDTKLETETGPQEELLHENTRMSKYVDTISRSLKF